jgi:ribosomal protein S18 acetylase RimI-like enzyme
VSQAPPIRVEVDGSRQHLEDAARIWAEATAVRDRESEIAPLALSREVIRAALDGSPRSLLLVALDESECALGFVAAVPRPASGGDAKPVELTHVGVDPAVWGGGVGSTLLRSTADALRAEGFSRAFLEVYEDNERAVGLYERLGWRPTGAVHPHPRSGRALRDFTLEL